VYGVAATAREEDPANKVRGLKGVLAKKISNSKTNGAAAKDHRSSRMPHARRQED